VFDRRKISPWYDTSYSRLGLLVRDAVDSLFVRRVDWCEGLMGASADPRLHYYGSLYVGAHVRCLLDRRAGGDRRRDPRSFVCVEDGVWGQREHRYAADGGGGCAATAVEEPRAEARDFRDVLRVFMGVRQSGKHASTVRERAVSSILETDLRSACVYAGVSDEMCVRLDDLCWIEDAVGLRKAVTSLRLKYKRTDVPRLYAVRAWDSGPVLVQLSGNNREAHLARLARQRRARHIYHFCPVCFLLDTRHPSVRRRTKQHRIEIRTNQQVCDVCTPHVPVVAFSFVGAAYVHNTVALAACTRCLSLDSVTPESFLADGLFVCRGCAAQ
jgi:hypothetical protein